MNLEGFTQAFSGLADWWVRYGTTVILWALVGAAVFVVGSLLWARKERQLPRWMSVMGNTLVLALSAEGMWEFFRELLGLPIPIAVGGFAFGEFLLISSMMHARAHYQRTTIRENGDKDGKVLQWGTTGRHGRAVWIIASVLGVIVATGADRWEEVPFRLALPLGAALMWHTELTAAGVGESEQSSWQWTPRRLFVWLGAIKPGKQDLTTVDRDQLIRRMTNVRLKLDAQTWPYGWWSARLRRLARNATDEVVAAVLVNVRRAKHIVELTSPGEVSAHEAELMAATEHAAQLQREHVAEVERLGAVHDRDQAAAAAEWRALSDQVAQLRDQLEQVSLAASERDQEAATTISALQANIQRLRPAAEQVARLQAERDAALTERNAALNQAASIAQRVPQWTRTDAKPVGGDRDVVAPRASAVVVDGSTVRKVEPAPAPAVVLAPDMSDKERVLVVLDSGLASRDIHLEMSSQDLAGYATDKLRSIKVDPGSVKRYARDWAHDVEAGKRPGVARRGLRLVAAGDRK